MPLRFQDITTINVENNYKVAFGEYVTSCGHYVLIRSGTPQKYERFIAIIPPIGRGVIDFIDRIIKRKRTNTTTSNKN